jgi:hypothetical protein
MCGGDRIEREIKKIRNLICKKSKKVLYYLLYGYYNEKQVKDQKICGIFCEWAKQ